MPSQLLIHHGRPLPYPHTHRRQRIPYVPSLHLMQQRRGDTDPATTQRVTDSNRSAIDVYFSRIQSQITYTGQRLHGKSLIQLHQVEVLYRNPRSL